VPSFDKRPIGVFDSGIGGLTVAREIRKELPGEDLIYIGDTAHVPYGDKSVSELLEYARQILDFLVARGVKIIVAACNTSSSVSIPVVASQYPVPIIGVIEPGARGAVQATLNRKVGVLATEATARSSSYKKAIQKIDPGIQVWEVPCPKLVPLIEAGLSDGPEVVSAVEEYLSQLDIHQVDTVVLGCTHYPYLVPVIERLAKGPLKIVDPALETVASLRQSLEGSQALNGDKSGQIQYYATGSDESFFRLGRFFMGQGLDVVERAIMDEIASGGKECAPSMRRISDTPSLGQP
jgi:glutamate racemase